MDNTWKIFLYRAPNGEQPVQKFIDNLELKAQAKVRNTIHLLSEFGTRLSSPYVKKIIGTELWELRILGEDSIRILYIAITNKTFLLLHAFKKKKQKTPLKEIKTALNRLQDYKNRINK